MNADAKAIARSVVISVAEKGQYCLLDCRQNKIVMIAVSLPALRDAACEQRKRMKHCAEEAGIQQA